MDSHLDYTSAPWRGAVEPSDEMDENITDWEWPVAASHQQHAERVALFRPIRYDVLYDLDTSHEQESPEARVARQGKALSLNVSSGGMLLMMDHQPQVNQVLKIQVPTPVHMAKTPTLAEVCWMRKLPFATFPGIYFAGVKFLL